MRYVTIVWRNEQTGESEGPFFGKMSATRWYWNNGNGSYRLLPDEYEILVEYPGDLDNNDDLFYAAYQSYLQSYGPKPAMKQSNGWLGPDGKFYTCRAREHNDLGYDLHILYYGNINYALSRLRDLEKRGWLHTYADLVCWPETKLTQAQIDTLFDLAMLDPTTEFANSAMNIIEKENEDE